MATVCQAHLPFELEIISHLSMLSYIRLLPPSSKADITQILQTMANIYSRSGGADSQHKEVEDIANAWKESFASGDGNR